MGIENRTKNLYDVDPTSEEWENFLAYVNGTIIIPEDTIRTLWHSFRKEEEDGN